MVLPNFLIVGAQKCGTTSLFDILSHHPEVMMSKIKEVNYFTSEHKFNKGINFYSTFFENPTDGQKLIGEASPGYICTPGVPERIYHNLGVIKIVMIFRDPIKRAFSQYWDNRRHLSDPMSEEQIVKNYLEETYDPLRKGYFSRGVYLPQLLKYEELFGKENVHVLILEDLISNQQYELKKLYQFLGVKKDFGLQLLPPAKNASYVWNNKLYNYFLKYPFLTTNIPKRMRRLFFFGKKKPFKYKLPQEKLMAELKLFYTDIRVNSGY